MLVVAVSACPERSSNGKQRKIYRPLWPTDVGRILRTFKIKKNVEVTDNGKIII